MEYNKENGKIKMMQK